MTPEQVVNAIRADFRAEIDLKTSSITDRVQYENVSFSPPESGLWASFHVQLGDSIHAEAGSQRTFRIPGVMFASLFAPVNSGTKDIGEVSDAIISEYQGVNKSQVVFFAPSVRRIGKRDDYFMQQVLCPFHHDQFRVYEVGELAYPSTVILPVKVSHSADTSDADWHVQVQLAELSDESFSSPIVDRATTDAQTNWTYRNEGYTADGALTSYPSGGVSTNIDDAVGDLSLVATAFYRLTLNERIQLTRGDTYWVRTRQSDDSGSTWSNWTISPITVH